MSVIQRLRQILAQMRSQGPPPAPDEHETSKSGLDDIDLFGAPSLKLATTRGAYRSDLFFVRHREQAELPAAIVGARKAGLDDLRELLDGLAPNRKGCAGSAPTSGEAASGLAEALAEQGVALYRLDSAAEPGDHDHSHSHSHDRASAPDALDYAYALEELDSVQAVPVAAFGPAGHWVVAPGSKREPVKQPQVEESLRGATYEKARKDDRDGYFQPGAVAVLDTGWIEDDDLPLNKVTPLDPSVDIDANQLDFKGHGMFIASLIRLTAPDVPVSELRIGPAGAELVFVDHHGERQPSTNVTFSDELQFMAAVVRANTTGATVLNISGGCYGTGHVGNVHGAIPPEDPAPIGMDLVLRWWASQDPDRRIVAAAGNDGLESGEPLFYPAGLALGDYGHQVIGVVATSSDGKPADFSNRGPGGDGPGEPYAWAPGDGLVGWVPHEGTVAWSGTSFATALVSGQIASGIEVPAGGEYLQADFAGLSIDTAYAANRQSHVDKHLEIGHH